MPVREISPSRCSAHEQLVRELAREWASPQQGGGEPVILQERDRGGRLVHVYVVWSQFENVDRVARSEIIMEAAEKKLAPDEIPHITIAMGLTPDEARRMGISH